MSNDKKVTSNEQKGTSNEQKVTSSKHKVTRNEQKATRKNHLNLEIENISNVIVAYFILHNICQMS